MITSELKYEASERVPRTFAGITGALIRPANAAQAAGVPQDVVSLQVFALDAYSKPGEPALSEVTIKAKWSVPPEAQGAAS